MVKIINKNKLINNKASTLNWFNLKIPSPENVCNDTKPDAKEIMNKIDNV